MGLFVQRSVFGRIIFAFVPTSMMAARAAVCFNSNAALLWTKLASNFVPLASWARFTEITFPFSAEGERNLSPGEKGEKIEGHYNVITSYPADPGAPEIECCFLEDMKGRRRAAYRGRREHVNREKRENIST